MMYKAFIADKNWRYESVVIKNEESLRNLMEYVWNPQTPMAINVYPTEGQVEVVMVFDDETDETFGDVCRIKTTDLTSAHKIVEYIMVGTHHKHGDGFYARPIGEKE